MEKTKKVPNHQPDESVKEHLGRCARICAHDAQSVVQKGKASLASPG